MINGRLASLVLAVLAGAATAYVLRVSQPLGQDVSDSPIARRVLNDERSPRWSPPSFDLTIVAFTDYQCPACRRADRELRAAATRDGHIRIVYKEWPIFGAKSEAAAGLALAAHKQNCYLAVRKELFRSPSLSEPAYNCISLSDSGDRTDLQTTLAANRSEITEDLLKNAEEALALGLRGTPGYLAGPLLIEGGLSQQQFLEAFKQARRAQSKRNE